VEKGFEECKLEVDLPLGNAISVARFQTRFGNASMMRKSWFHTNSARRFSRSLRRFVAQDKEFLALEFCGTEDAAF
jgi:hypothetical protein